LDPKRAAEAIRKLTPGQRQVLLTRSRCQIAQATLDTISAKRPADDVLEASPAQTALWMFHQLFPATRA